MCQKETKMFMTPPPPHPPPPSRCGLSSFLNSHEHQKGGLFTAFWILTVVLVVHGQWHWCGGLAPHSPRFQFACSRAPGRPLTSLCSLMRSRILLWVLVALLLPACSQTQRTPPVPPSRRNGEHCGVQRQVYLEEDATCTHPITTVALEPNKCHQNGVCDETD